jgi:hypothetical protein
MGASSTRGACMASETVERDAATAAEGRRIVEEFLEA